MPRELIAIAPRTPAIREYDDPPLGPKQVCIRTEFASPKHGTELVAYRNDPEANRPYDPNSGVVKPISSEEGLKRFPFRLGNMAVGTVTEIGSEVTRFRVGDRVFGHLPIRETHTVDESKVDAVPEGISDEALVCLDPAVMAMAIRDARIDLGDRVAVFGLGAIGLMAVQMARLAGADMIIGVDPVETRRKLAESLGADVTLDPTVGDVGVKIRELTPPFAPIEGTSPRRVIGGYRSASQDRSGSGVDVSIEVSGNTIALQQAIRSTGFGGRVCVLSFYGRDASGLYLGDEFHINRIELISARSESLPMREYPRWNLDRYVSLALKWLAEGKLRVEGIIQPVVPFDDAPEAYKLIDEHPDRAIKLGIIFP